MNQIGRTRKIDHAVIGGTRLQLVGVFFGNAFYQTTLYRAQHGLVNAGGFGFNHFVQSFQTAHFFGVGGVVGQIGGGRTRARAVNKHKAQVKRHVFYQF